MVSYDIFLLVVCQKDSVLTPTNPSATPVEGWKFGLPFSREYLPAESGPIFLGEFPAETHVQPQLGKHRVSALVIC